MWGPEGKSQTRGSEGLPVPALLTQHAGQDVRSPACTKHTAEDGCRTDAEEAQGPARLAGTNREAPRSGGRLTWWREKRRTASSF